MSIELKIKSKHLSAEAGIIRFEEQKIKRHLQHLRAVRNELAAKRPSEDAPEEERAAFLESLRAANQSIDKAEAGLSSIQIHRSCIVGQAARHTYLARAFLSGKAYRQIENENTHTTPNHFEIAKMVAAYGAPTHARFLGRDATKIRGAVVNWLLGEEVVEPNSKLAVQQNEIAA